MNILLTGGYGFFGSHFYDLYKDELNIFRFRKEEYNLEHLNETENLFAAARNYFNNETFSVIHLAGWNGGIEWNKLYPAQIYQSNVTMGNNVFRMCSTYKVDKLVSCLASCAFPVRDREIKAFEILYKEPHESVMCHGYAKRHLELLTRMYSHQYYLNAVTFCPPTLFGPGDKTDVKRCKFLPAVIIKMLSNPNEVTFMGDGSAYREVLYVKEACVQLKKCLDEQPSCGLRNVPFICEGVNKRIKGFVEDVARILDYKGEIKWTGEIVDNGQNYKSFSKPWNFKWNLSWFENGLLDTIEWYKQSLGV